MIKVGCQVMSIALLPLICASCATEGGILYGSKIDLEAGSGDGNDSNAESRAVLRADIARLWPRGPLPADAQTVVGAGDIAESGGRQMLTSNLLFNVASSARIVTLGDNAYPSGTTSNFNAYFHPTWGRFKSRIWPTPGNHDYQTTDANGYYTYFGAVASRSTCGFYTRALGSYWTGIFMNSERCISAQTGRLRTALQNGRAANKNVALFWHKPRFAIGSKLSVSALAPWWSLADEYNVDLIFTGHEHFFASIGPRLASGAADPNGTREFMVGTGGADLRACRNLPSMALTCISQHGIFLASLQQTQAIVGFRDIAGATRYRVAFNVVP
jgi:acid phosphatase type 7